MSVKKRWTHYTGRREVVNRACQQIESPLNEQEIRSGLNARRIGHTIHLFEVVGSTNDQAAEMAARGTPEGTVIIAEGQHDGRGRMGRRWESPKWRGLYLSVILRPPIRPQEAPALTLLGALAGADAIDLATALVTGIKWPNDLIVQGRKVGGVLGEMAAETSRVHHVIIGIGINVNQTEADFREELRGTAGSLRIEAGGPVNRTLIARALCERLDDWYDRFLSNGFTPVLEGVRRRCVTLGREVVARSGDYEVSGMAVGLDDTGALVIRDACGELHHLLAGDVTMTG